MLITGIDFPPPRWFAILRSFAILRGLAGAACLLALAATARADSFAGVYYDPAKDELVVTMVYDGTNPDHEFSLQWGECKVLHAGDVPEIDAVVIDSQWNDEAHQQFTKTVRFPLSGLNCSRPVNVTLRSPPRFYRTLQIPAS
jgi:hypothetical protein